MLFEWIVLIVFLPLVWLGLLALLRWQSGWGRLAALYRQPRDLGDSLQEFRLASVFVGLPYFPAQFAFSINVAVHTGGLTFRPALVYAFLFPKLYLPWYVLVAVEERTPIFESFNFRADGAWPTFAVLGQCGRHCAARWRTNLLITPQAPS